MRQIALLALSLVASLLITGCMFQWQSCNHEIGFRGIGTKHTSTYCKIWADYKVLMLHNKWI